MNPTNLPPLSFTVVILEESLIVWYSILAKNESVMKHQQQRRDIALRAGVMNSRCTLRPNKAVSTHPHCCIVVGRNIRAREACIIRTAVGVTILTMYGRQLKWYRSNILIEWSKVALTML